MSGSLTRYVWVSVGAAVTTIALKSGAYVLTGSVGLLSDALESIVNLIAALFALFALQLAETPPDEQHAYGHGKAEYFSGSLEGGLILAAAVLIIVTAIERLIHPRELENLSIGFIASIIASLVNGAVGLWLLRAGRSHRSLTLEADGKHLLTDVWTTAGVLVGVGLVAVTKWQWLDPAVAIFVALNILYTGISLIRKSLDGLLDASVSVEDKSKIEEALTVYRKEGLVFHEIRTRQAGARCFVEMHMLVPPSWTVQQAHDKAEQVEQSVQAALPCSVTTHIEPVDDPVSYQPPM